VDQTGPCLSESLATIVALEHDDTGGIGLGFLSKEAIDINSALRQRISLRALVLVVQSVGHATNHAR
jgi:hypothetical protein